MRRAGLICLGLVSLSIATPAAAQLQFDARLDKAQYLSGEPVTATVELRNVGTAAIPYSTCSNDMGIEVVGEARRSVRELDGCAYPGLAGTGFGCGVSEGGPPMLRPGQSATFSILLKDYDLTPGRHVLMVSLQINARQPAAARFERQLSIDVFASTEDSLKRALAPLVADAEGADLRRRHPARTALIESAPPFLTGLIGRVAEEETYRYSAIDALRRIGTAESRAELKRLFNRFESVRPSVIGALSYLHRRDDFAFFAAVLRNPSFDDSTRNVSALAIGAIGGDRAVDELARALSSAPPERRATIAQALGVTGSRRAVNVLIGMYGNNLAQPNVCAALNTLTHRDWCDGNPLIDPAARRRKWLRAWQADKSAAVFLPMCMAADDVDRDDAEARRTARVWVEPPRSSATPNILSVRPAVVAPQTMIGIHGAEFRSENRRVFFVQDGVELSATIRGGGDNFESNVQDLDVVVPATITPGPWNVVVDVDGRRSAPIAIDISEPSPVTPISISPARPHPAQFVFIETDATVPAAPVLELIDARGREWRLTPHPQWDTLVALLPDELADGVAMMRIGRNIDGTERFGAPMNVFVTSAPLPLNRTAVEGMMAVSPGQWTDLSGDDSVAFEIDRVDRIDVEFRQGSAVVTTQTIGLDGTHLQIPSKLRPGPILVRTRTWIEQRSSEWSEPSIYEALDAPMPSSVQRIEVGPLRTIAWVSGDATPATVFTRPGDAIVLTGLFPVRRPADLRLRLRTLSQSSDLVATEVRRGGIEVRLPPRLPSGDWELVIEPRDRRTPAQVVATIRVEGSAR